MDNGIWDREIEDDRFSCYLFKIIKCSYIFIIDATKDYMILDEPNTTRFILDHEYKIKFIEGNSGIRFFDGDLQIGVYRVFFLSESEGFEILLM